MDDRPAQQNDLLTEEEAATLLRVKRFTLRKWRRTGGGPRFVRCGWRLVRYARTDIDDWLSYNKFASNAAELLATTNVK
jgi:excisionase family DNA binding protein